ncbi:MAG TPA: GNAT family N-acetyltransferase [Rhizomicrobium sp.]|jgi:RimJ/RimL family protein N-acetyltransferase|nr:GNAT family N-acetyltransferase [Rhizomicrobium sp.]
MPSFRLESERLLLRPPDMGDVPAIAAQMNDWDVVKNLSRPPFPYTVEDARAFVAGQEENRNRGSDFAFAVVLKSGGALVGSCGVHPGEEGYELGYWIGRAHWGRGYATEAAREVVAFAFRNLRAPDVWAGWFHDNPASGRVLEKVGFRANGSQPRNSAARGCSVPCNLVTMSRADFGQRFAA